MYVIRKKEREDILQELMVEEQKEALERRHREEIEKQIRQRIEVRESLTEQLKEKEDRCRQEAIEDGKYKQQLLDKLAEDEKLEQMSAQKKRMKMLQLRRDIEQMMIDRRQQRAEEMQRLIRLKEQEDQQMKNRSVGGLNKCIRIFAFRNKIIEEERIRLLKTHVKNLVGYLPKGLLKPNDLPHLAGVI
ncbi:hypothetical protein D910_12157 [Dendroctonus ponderosae]|uniref:Meiosis-specific nuclear structural protein 1 n=1 Tax=Dendroctonus ponderosae TaxID=77166 RepID=U4ULE9_DENPD|nr:hypothetical protein D910_12157 [Dendroctonus ponderosae]